MNSIGAKGLGKGQRIADLDKRADEYFKGRVVEVDLPTRLDYAEAFYNRLLRDWPADGLPEKELISVLLSPESGLTPTQYDGMSSARLRLVAEAWRSIHEMLSWVIALGQAEEIVASSLVVGETDGLHMPLPDLISLAGRQVRQDPSTEKGRELNEHIPESYGVLLDARNWWSGRDITLSQLADFVASKHRAAEREYEREVFFEGTRRAAKHWAYKSLLAQQNDSGHLATWDEITGSGSEAFLPPAVESPGGRGVSRLPLPLLYDEVPVVHTNAVHDPFKGWIKKTFSTYLARFSDQGRGRPTMRAYEETAERHALVHGHIIRRRTEGERSGKCSVGTVRNVISPPKPR